MVEEFGGAFGFGFEVGALFGENFLKKIKLGIGGFEGGDFFPGRLEA